MIVSRVPVSTIKSYGPELFSMTGTIIRERPTMRGRILATFPGQCGSAQSSGSMTRARLADVSHLRDFMEGHLSLVGWVNSPLVASHGLYGFLLISLKPMMVLRGT